MWTDGIGTPPESSLPGLKIGPPCFQAETLGTFYPTSMKINPDGRLVVRFKTVAQFTGMFVLEHPGRYKAVLETPCDPHMDFVI